MNLISTTNSTIIERTLQDLRLQGKADSTIACYRSDLNKCGAALTTIDLDFTDLTKKNLTSLLEIVQTNQAGLQLSPGRLSGVFSALSSLMEFLEFNDEIDTNPVPSFRKRYLTPYKRQGGLELPRFCPTTEQVRTVVSLAPNSRDKAIHILFAKTGLRKKELRALDVDDINLVEKYVMAKPSAKRTGRKLPLDDECCLFLGEWLHDRRFFKNASIEVALFIGPLGARVGRNKLGELITRDGLAAGLHDPNATARQVDRKFTPHVYRHYLTTTLRDNKCSERVIRYIRGDADASIIDRYDHLKWETIADEYCASTEILFTNSN